MIAFTSNRGGGPDIYTSEAAPGAPATRLTAAPGFDGSPAFSPDGSRIAFTSERDGRAQIYVMDVDGSNQVNVSNSDANDFDPTWSPGGGSIAFTRLSGGSDVYAMASDGSEQTNLTASVGSNEFDPDIVARGRLGPGMVAGPGRTGMHDRGHLGPQRAPWNRRGRRRVRPRRRGRAARDGRGRRDPGWGR